MNTNSTYKTHHDEFQRKDREVAVKEKFSSVFNSIFNNAIRKRMRIKTYFYMFTKFNNRISNS